MELGITVPTNPGDLNKTLELTVDPSKNITVMGSCPKNATKEVGLRDYESPLLMYKYIFCWF